MSSRHTPETDAVAEKNIYGVACKVDVDFARKLERERDEARAERDICLEDFIKARKHREQLNSLLQSYEACWDEIKAALGEPEEGDQTCDLDRVLKAIRERDEAREENKKFREALEWISKRYDDSKPTHAVAMDCYEMSCTARAVLQKEETK